MSEIRWRELMSEVLAFFGAVTASATHEIKNELAVINEQGSLIQELLQLADQGRQVDPARLQELIGRVLARVGQADQAVKRLNAFAHGADLDREATDPAQALELMARMHGRLAGLKGIALEVAPVAAGQSLPLRPLLFQQATWACLQGVVAAAQKGGTVRLEFEVRGEMARLVVSGDLERPPTAPAGELMAALGAKVEASADRGLQLDLPLGGGDAPA